VEIVLVKIRDLLQILVLHLATSLATATRGVVLYEKNLVDYDVVSVDLVTRQFLHQALGLVEGKELGDADANEGAFIRVAKSSLDGIDLGCRETEKNERDDVDCGVTDSTLKIHWTQRSFPTNP
jgi:hypothetical protein